jgi:glycosyltransferase involved in cell wall biosynthesis
MRIAMVGPFGFHPNKTMRSRALPLARVLTKRGHEVKMFMPPWQEPGSAGRDWREAGVELRYTPLRAGVLGTTAILVREAVSWKPEVVHCFKPKAYSGLAAWWFWHFHRRRLRLVVDSDDWEGAGGWNDLAQYSRLQKRFFAWQEKWGLAHSHALTVASRALQTLAWSRGVPAARVFYLPNGPGIAADGSNGAQKRAELGLAGRPTILLYSRLFEFEIGRLIEVLRRVLTVMPRAAVLSVGAGLFEDDAQELNRRMAELGLEDHLVNAGWLDEETLPIVLAAADAALYLMDDTLLNRTKCPVKLADMLALGLPVVAEAVGQVPEYVVQDKGGLLRSPGDVDGLASDLLHLLQDKEARDRLGAGGRVHIEARFSWERLAVTAEAAYQGD